MNIENWKRKTNMTSEQFALGKLFFMNQLSEETLELKNVTTNNLTTLGVKFQRDKKMIRHAGTEIALLQMVIGVLINKLDTSPELFGKLIN